METAQIVQSLRQQAIQQNGISSGISRMLGSGFSFSDIILTMLSNTGLGGDLQNEKAIPSQYGEIIDILSENLMSGEMQFPVIPQENGDIDLKNSDFFGNLISVDPSQLSGLLGFVMTGSDTLRNSGQLSADISPAVREEPKRLPARIQRQIVRMKADCWIFTEPCKMQRKLFLS